MGAVVWASLSLVSVSRVRFLILPCFVFIHCQHMVSLPAIHIVCVSFVYLLGLKLVFRFKFRWLQSFANQPCLPGFPSTQRPHLNSPCDKIFERVTWFLHFNALFSRTPTSYQDAHRSGQFSTVPPPIPNPEPIQRTVHTIYASRRDPPPLAQTTPSSTPTARRPSSSSQNTASPVP